MVWISNLGQLRCLALYGAPRGRAAPGRFTLPDGRGLSISGSFAASRFSALIVVERRRVALLSLMVVVSRRTTAFSILEQPSVGSLYRMGVGFESSTP